jgi:hypothetical protein
MAFPPHDGSSTRAQRQEVCSRMDAQERHCSLYLASTGITVDASLCSIPEALDHDVWVS